MLQQEQEPTMSTPSTRTLVPVPDLWIDAEDAEDRLGSMTLEPSVRRDVETFIRNGYVIIPGAIPADEIDRIVEDTIAVYANPRRYVLKYQGAYVDPVGLEALGRGHRIVDMYAVSPAARRAVFAPPVSRMLQAIFGEPAIAMQSISFEFGSQQAIHQDTAYVIAQKPLALAAIWIALEDIAFGTGELIYYPGGHRFPPWQFGKDRRHWIAGQDGQEAHKAFLASLNDHAKARGIKMERFLARKGDVLVWHADLPHGGSKIQKDHTRRSLVFHFVPESVKATYMKVIGADYFELPSPSGDFFTSRHYDLKRLDADGRAPILYDGGVSRRREPR